MSFVPDEGCGLAVEAAAARTLFPRGLFQPEGSFRFSLDALLLGAFIEPRKQEKRLADLGCGCGVVGLSMLLRHETLTAVGIDIRGELAEAARINAVRLGLKERFSSVAADLAVSLPSGFGGSFDLALANPPYRRANQGRQPKDAARNQALFECDEGSLDIFCRAAVRLLKRGGRFGVIFSASRLPDLCGALHSAGLGLRRLLPVHIKSEEPAALVLAEARAGAGADVAVLPPLVLYAQEAGAARISPQTLAFCPALACNAR